MFGDDDMNFNLQLEEWEVDTDALKESEVIQLFHGWVEEWEEVIHKKHNAVDEAKILQKYKNLVFYDHQYKKTY